MAELHDDCYAYSAKHKYPIHTKLATLKSYAEYLLDILNIPSLRCLLINLNFVKAAALHDIKLYSPISLPVVRLTNSYTDELGNTVVFTKISTITDVLLLNNKLDSLRLDLTHLTFKKLAMYGFQLGLNLGAAQSTLDSLQKKAGLGIGDKLLMLDQFLKRASLLILPMQQQETFYRLYNSMNNLDLLVLFKKASDIYLTLYNIDKLYNLTDRYNTLLKAPLLVCCSTTVDSLLKEASDFLHVLSTDTVLSKLALLLQKDKVLSFLQDHYNFKAADNLQLFTKVASLSKHAITSLLETLE